MSGIPWELIAAIVMGAVAYEMGRRTGRRERREANPSPARSCTCGFAASIGGRDPQCPTHGQHNDGPDGDL